MAPGAQSASDFVNGRVTRGYSGTMTLEERRMKMREGVANIRSSASPKPRRELHRFNSISSIDRPATSFEDHRGMYYKRGDRWDTDTEALDDSTIDPLDYSQSRNLHDFARSPAPEESAEVSEATDEEDKYSVSVSVRTEPAIPLQHTSSYPLQSLNGALNGQTYGNGAVSVNGSNTNNWGGSSSGALNFSRTRPAGMNRAPSGSISGNDYHQKYFQQHNFRQGFAVGNPSSAPFSSTRTSHSPSLRPRDTSAPPLRTRTMSPTISERMNGNGRMNGYSSSQYNGGYNNMMPPSSDDTIDETVEYGSDAMEVGQARTVHLTHQKSFSNMSQASGISRTSSTSDMRGLRSPRFRTKRSHLMGRKRNRAAGAAQELDYSQTELAAMNYRQLAEEPFDENPKFRNLKSGGIEFPEDVKTLEEKCNYMRSRPERETGGAPQTEETRTPQEVFFSMLSIDDFEECGEHIVDQLTDLVSRLRKLRREKRQAARDFEDEVGRREADVSTKMENLQSEFTRLKKSGQEALAAAASKV